MTTEELDANNPSEAEESEVEGQYSRIGRSDESGEDVGASENDAEAQCFRGNRDDETEEIESSDDEVEGQAFKAGRDEASDEKAEKAGDDDTDGALKRLG